MKITFPHMGNVYIAVEAFLRGLGHEPVTPPPSSRRTLELGSFHSPAEVCLPFKIALGNMLEGMAQGAEAVLMIGGWGPCRLGYYAEIQRLLLQALGREVEFITLEVPRRPYAPYAANLRKLIAPTRFSSLARGAGLSWAKLKAVEELEGLALKVRPREMRPGAATEYLQEQLERLRAAETAAEVEELRQAARRDLPQLAGRERNQPLRLGIVGEIYTVVEPFANLRLEERLGYLGVEVVRTISLVEWVTNHIFKKAAGLSSLAPLRRLAAGYLRGFIGGHGLESIARSVALARQNLDGIIHILPLSCMPEIVARGILPGLSREQGIPVLSLVVDDHTAEAGFQTRLEAFVDLVGRRVGSLGHRQSSVSRS